MANAYGAASFYRWEVAGKPIAILISLELMDRLERDVIERFKAVTQRGAEIGGVLGGRIVAGSQPTVVIEQFEPVECDYSRGAAYLLSEHDKARLRQALERVGADSVAGFFRSNARRELALDEEDAALVDEFFPDPNQVVLLVRPFAMKPCVGGFFFREDGQLTETSYLQFPFKSSELGTNFPECLVGAPEARVEPLPAAPAGFEREEIAPSAVAPPAPAWALAPATVPVRPAILEGNFKPSEASPSQREERPAPVMVKPAMPKPVETIPAAVTPPQREERPAPVMVRPVTPKPAENIPAALTAPQREERPAPVMIKPVAAKAAQALPVIGPPPAPAANKATVPEAARELVAAVSAPAGQRGVLSRIMWVVAILAITAGAGGARYFFARRSGPEAAPARAADRSLGLRLVSNAGQLVLSWNPNAPLVAGATRATLTISDGDRKEDVSLDLATLHTGSIVYTPISNDASFRLDVADRQTGLSGAESVRRLAGMPSTTASSAPEPFVPAQESAPAAAPAQPAQPTVAQQRPTPRVVAALTMPAQTAVEDSLAARLSVAKPVEIPAAPALESRASASAANLPNVPVATAAQLPPAPAPAQPRPPQQAAVATPIPAPTASAPTPRIGGQAQKARLVKQFPVVYPLTAKRWHASGVVRVIAVVGKDGRVKKATAVSGLEVLRPAAVASVMKWIYVPEILNGEPVEGEAQVDVSFGAR